MIFYEDLLKMNIFTKKGQVTIFVILGLVLVIGVFLRFFLLAQVVMLISLQVM